MYMAGGIGLGVLLQRTWLTWFWNWTDPEDKLGHDKTWLRIILLSFWVAMPLSGALIVTIVRNL